MLSFALRHPNIVALDNTGAVQGGTGTVSDHKGLSTRICACALVEATATCHFSPGSCQEGLPRTLAARTHTNTVHGGELSNAKGVIESTTTAAKTTARENLRLCLNRYLIS